MDDPEPWSDRIRGIFRSAAVDRYYRPSSRIWRDRIAASCRYRKELFKSADVCSDHRTGGAVLGYLARNLKDAKAKELCIPSFISVLFGITEPALFGVNLRYRYSEIARCIGGAIGGAVVYFTDLAALGFGTTVVPGIALADPAHNGYVNYIIAHVIALAAGFLFAFLIGIGFDKKRAVQAAAPVSTVEQKETVKTVEAREEAQEETAALPEEIGAFTKGDLIGIEEVNDQTFARKVLGDGIAIVPKEGAIYAPADADVEIVMDTKHALGLRTKAGNGILIHVGIDTVNLGGRYFTLHTGQGRSVKKGELLLEFDQEKIKAEGYDTTTSLIITEPVADSRLEKEADKPVQVGDRIWKS